MKERISILNKLAQQIQSVPVANNISLPPNFKASDIWGWLSKDYNSQTINTINGLISILNISLHYASNGKINFQILKNNNFQVDPSSAPSIDAKNLIYISSMFYHTYLNSGNEFTAKPTNSQIADWNSRLINSPSFLNLSQINSTSILAHKLQGNPKDLISNYLRYIAMYNPK